MPNPRIGELLAAARACRSYADLIIPMLEQSWNIVIDVDLKILEEAYLRGLHTLGDLEIDDPNHVKQAAHFSFWIRKLKPAKAISLQGFNDLFLELSDKNLITGALSSVNEEFTVPARARYLNEMFSVLTAIGILRDSGETVRLSPAEFNDLVVSLRYHSYSPSALQAILQAHVKNGSQ